MNLKLLFGGIPDGEKYESLLNHLQEEYNRLLAIEASDVFKEYQALSEFVHSPACKEKKKELVALKYKKSDAYQQEKELRSLERNKDIKRYFKLINSNYLQDFERIEQSDTLERYKELEAYLQSDEFLGRKKEILSQKTGDNEGYQKWKEWKGLKASNDIKFYFTFQKSALYKNYLKVKDSELLEKYHALKEYIESDQFKQEKEYLLLSPQEKYALTDEYKQEARYNELLQNPDIQWYIKNHDHKRFDEFKQCQLTFEDDFTTGKLNKNVWLTRYYWGEELLQSNYSLADEKQCFTEKNLQFSDSSVKIITQRENAEGMVWSPVFGFVPRQFEYTSGLLSTGKSFRQQYGIFEAKIRFSPAKSITHAFWMVSDRIMPHVDVMKTNGKVTLGNYWGDMLQKNGIHKNRTKIGSSKLSGYNIYRLEWTQQGMEWKINGTTIYKTTKGIPQEPLFLVFSSHLYNDLEMDQIPSTMELDWVRCYQKAVEE